MIRFAILGTGESAEKFYQANRFARGFELAAVYDIEMDRVKEFCFRKGQPAAYDDLADWFPLTSYRHMSSAKAD